MNKMKLKIYCLIPALCFLIAGCSPGVSEMPSSDKNTAHPSSGEMDVKAAYLGQIPPGLTPGIFAPGIVSLEATIEYAATFSSDGTEIYFSRRTQDGESQEIYETHWLNGTWTEPAPVLFSAAYKANEPHITSDNKTLYFGWDHPLPAGEKNSMGVSIWAADRTAQGWSDPRYIGAGMFVSSDQNGEIYVTSFAGGSPKLCKVNLTAGQFSDYETLTGGVHPAIAPDGSYLIYDNGDGSLRVIFRIDDDTWSSAKDLTKQGLPASASIASLTPDGKYLFYSDNGDLYWVSTDLIHNLNQQ